MAIQTFVTPSREPGFVGDNVAFELVGSRLMLFVHSRNKMTGTEAASVRDIYRQIGDISKYVALVITDGGAPTRDQRDAVQREFGKAFETIRTAVVTDESAVRFIVATLTIVVRGIKTFESTDIIQACSFLGVRMDEVDGILRRLQVIGSKVGSGVFKTLDAINSRSRPT